MFRPPSALVAHFQLFRAARTQPPCALEQLNALGVNAAANPPLSVAAALGFWGRGSSGSARASAGAASSRYSPLMGGASAEDQ